MMRGRLNTPRKGKHERPGKLCGGVDGLEKCALSPQAQYGDSPFFGCRQIHMVQSRGRRHDCGQSPSASEQRAVELMAKPDEDEIISSDTFEKRLSRKRPDIDFKARSQTLQRFRRKMTRLRDEESGLDRHRTRSEAYSNV
jgi:hypothetical protein